MDRKAVAYIGGFEVREKAYYELVNYAKEKGFKLEKIFLEEEAGSFDELMNYCLRKGLKVILVTDLSSLGTTLKEVVNRYEALLRRGFKVVKVKSEISDVRDEELLKVLKWVLKVEHSIIVYKTKKGLERARSLGKPIGRPRKPLPKDAILELYHKGLSVSKIATLFGVSRATLYRRLKEWRALPNIERS
ncbi:MAG: hypothetical protein B6U69_03205 [Thermofilum sp. ex4484_15]|nr:MAG: hypothetical protein B6U69_03205 [Thermofilum sp. ex4484_15]